MQNPLTSILLVEDDEVDVEAVRRAFRKMKVINPLLVAADGVAALKMLQGDSAAVRPPYVIVLDLNLPRMSGIDFLNVLRHDGRLKDSVVFVLTTSNSDRDRRATAQYNVTGYLLKSDNGDDCDQLLRKLRPVLRYAAT
jgi:DNA-binding NarL/FixJ family response regulator